MVFCAVLGGLVLAYYFTYLFLLCFLDCDIGLAFYEYFGRSLGKLENKVIWITGASSGIGEAMAYEAAKQKAKLVLTARRVEELERVKNNCLKNSKDLSENDILVVPMDVTNFSEHQESFVKVLRHFGHIDILINNAGRSQRAKWEDIELEVDRKMFELNVFGVIALSRLVVRHFNERGKGRLAVTSSLAGIIGAPFSGTYTATKHAIHGYFESLRNEKLGSNIQITLLCPGPVFSQFLQESFTEQADKKFGVAVQENDRRMTAARCAKLSLVAVVNNLDEAWMALFPIVPLVYAIIYFPNLSRIVTKYVGAKRFQNLRDSRPTVNT